MSSVHKTEQIQNGDSRLRRLYNHRFGRFLIVGASATGIQYLVLIALAESHLFPTVLCSAISFVVSALYNYLANYYFTFQANGSHGATSLRFLVTAGFGLVVNTTVFFAVELISPHYLASQIVATLVTLFVNYWLHKHWTYK